MQYGYENFQNVAPILHSVICSEMNTASATKKRLLEKERGSYKFMFSVETATFYCKKILQLLYNSVCGLFCLLISYWKSINSHS